MNRTLKTTWRSGNDAPAEGKTDPPGVKKQKTKKSKGLWALLFVGPSFAGILLFFLLPFIDTIRRSFYDVRGKNFTGADSYASVLGNETFRPAAYNTARFVAVSIPPLLAISLGLALLVRAVRPGGRSFKTTYLLSMAGPVASRVLLG